ncbi:PREDICTED: uncharacterized protein LOC108614709 [Drosophila arizonae]|uniref:Uncharacterized protein LOC108614709 n=1 Tax=Drosophila arizonae TaxID=7263 RepID=A0ABM1PB48_DROAR|nr:PREDICTED: uncharacterized protein LOC108614709 [Drosophila arizonae]
MVKPKDEGPGVLISVQEMKEREKKYMQKLQEIKVCCNFIKESSLEFHRLEEERSAVEHWENFLRCNGLPRPYLPPEMRQFLAKKRYYQQFFTERSVDWTLSVDDRTILTQNIFRKDLTRQTVKEQLNDAIGDQYERDITMFLDTLNKIDRMLDTAIEMERVDFARQMEIMEARREIEHEIDDSFDRLTYRVIRMDGVYMDSLDGLVATWSHSCPRYGIDIWALRDVPVRFEELLAPLMVAEMAATSVRVQMPLSVLHDCLTLRCIHSNFDNYSQYAKSFDPPIPEGNVDVNAGILDIEECLINEWLMQLDIQKELLAILLEKREIYEEIMRVITERTERAAKEKKNSDGKETKIVIPKPPKEALLVPPGMLPEPYNTFLEREQQQYLDLLDEIYHPRHLKIDDDVINLRQHILLGGLYSINFVRRPTDTHYQTFNVTLHEDGRLLHIKREVVADLFNSYRDSRLGPRATKVMTKRSKMLMDEQKRKTHMLEDDELPYFFVTIQMAREFCLWGTPIPCQYLDTMEEVKSETSIVEEKKEVVVKRKKSRISTLPTQQQTAAQVIEDSQLTQIRRAANSTINIFRPTLIALLRTSRKLLPGERVLPVENFNLMQRLDHQKIRQLERYCVPRILSSFKFPMEVREELEQQQSDNRPKPKNLLIRRRSVDTEEAVVVGDLDFDYNVQHAAERVYPVFESVERMHYAEDDINEPYYDKKSMYGLIETFDNISTRYITRHIDIMSQSDFTAKKPPKKALQSSDSRTGISFAKARSTVRIQSKHMTAIRPSNLGSTVMTGAQSSRTTMADEVEEAHSPETVPHTPEEQEVEAEKPKQRLIRWTTKHIISYKFDKEARTMNIQTDRLGIFGFAYKRYEHFPFRDWSLQPNEENNDEIILSVDTFHARVILYISAAGVRGYVTDITKNYVAHPVKYLDIQTPITDFRELRRRFYEKGINIFAENDACFYIDNGYFSVKHMATEDHTYDAMALHCKLMKFYRSSWNRLASRRNLLIGMKNAKDPTDYTEVTMRITPDNVTFVEVSELCSDDLDIIKLDFKNTWRNMSNYTDLHQAINSMNPSATDVRNKDPLLLFQVKRMLNEIHVMSFS